MAERRQLKAEDVVSHAEAAALFLRTLIDQGVPVTAAVSMAGQYVTAVVLAQAGERPPATPWDPPA